jgi:hypothetical protein
MELRFLGPVWAVRRGVVWRRLAKSGGKKTMEFLENLRRADENELKNMLLAKMTHLNERIANPPESIVDQILQIASLKIQVLLSLLILDPSLH